MGCARVSVVHVGERDLHERQGRFYRGQRNFRGRQGDFPISGRTTRFQIKQQFLQGQRFVMLTQFAGRLAPGDAD